MSTNETDREPETSETKDTPVEAPSGEGDSQAAAPTTDAPSEGETAKAEAPEASPEPEAEEAPAAVAVAAPASAPSSPKAEPAKAALDAMTPGQRIAAQKAAKAAKKAADRARRAEEEESKRAEEDADFAPAAQRRSAPAAPDAVELRAAEVRSLVERNSGRLWQVLAAAAVALVVAAGATFALSMRNDAAGRLLTRAVEASRAEIGPRPEIADGRTRFGSEAARDRETMRRFRKVVSSYPSSDAAARAHLAIAAMLIDQQKYGEAHAQLRDAREGIDGDPAFEAQILEANGYAYLGEQKYAEAQREFERLATIERRTHRYRDLADYLVARALFERGNRDGAKQKLVALLDRLDDPGATPVEHVDDQARSLLREIDPSALPAAPTFGGGGQITPEMLQQLLRQNGLQGGMPQ